MSHFSIAFHTLGCKLNQLETESIAQAFKIQGFRIVHWSEPADIYLVNTCTVTSKAEQKARRLIRKALVENPGACLIATGCYAQLDPEAIASIADSLADSFATGEIDSTAPLERRRIIVISGDDKDALLDLPEFIADSACSSTELPGILASWAMGARTASPSAIENSSSRFRFDANDFSFHSRASLKIQDGCDNSCSYCRVRLARGGAVSLPADEALTRLKELERRGYAEAVLTGVNISRYRDVSAPSGVVRDFPSLLRYLLAGTERIALRLSSTEPDSVTEDFADAISHPRVRPHFHLSVQSGSDAILKRMRRRYVAAQVERAVALLRSAKGDPFLACDIIAGFPGESNEDFESTYALCSSIGFGWIHAFPFSPRPGTEAVSLSGHVSERVAVERVERLGQLSRSSRGSYIDRWLDREVDAIVEVSSRLSSGWVVALSENYLKLAVSLDPSGPTPRAGAAIRCKIQSMETKITDIVPFAQKRKDMEIDARAEFLEIIL